MENLYSSILTIGGGFFAGTLIGYALKKVVKLVVVVVGLFLAGLAYLQYQQIVAISWNKIPRLLQNAANALANATTQIPVFSSDHTTSLAMKFCIPLTGSMAMGFAILPAKLVAKIMLIEMLPSISLTGLWDIFPK